MKYALTSICLLVWLAGQSQNTFHIEAGTTVENQGVLAIVNGNYVNFSTTPIGGSLKLDAADGNDYTMGSLAPRETFTTLTAWGPGKVSLLAHTQVDDELILNNDVHLDLTSSNMILGQSGRILGEELNNRITGLTGSYITTNQYHEIGIIQDFGGIGVTITSENFDLLDTDVTRHYGVLTINGEPTILRYYEIHTMEDGAVDLGAIGVFDYADIDLNGLDESQLKLYKSDDGSTNWTEEGGTVDAAANTITQNGVRSFSFWAIAQAGAILPVELMFFDAEAVNNNAVLCTWQTATEINNSHFEIERSKDGSAFEYVGQESGAGTTNTAQDYDYTDGQPYTGTSYYRLKQVDFDGTSAYSEIRKVYIDKGSGIILYPNPAREMVHVSLPKDIAVDGYAIYNMEGKLLLEGDAIASPGQLDLDISALAAGAYLLELSNENQTVKQLKLIKQ